MSMPVRIALALVFVAGAALAQSRVPLNDLGSAAYLGQFQGGLYEGGSNEMPFDHLADGLAHAARIRPLDADGNSSPNGKIVMMSLGMSHPSQAFCAERNPAPCEPWSFIGQARADPAVNHSTLVLVNGARASQTADSWLMPAQPNYDYVRDRDLAPAGVTEAQVQVAWVKLANPGPAISLPSADAEAYRLLTQWAEVLRAMKVRYKNLQMVYLASRSYAGYARIPLSPEPYAYEYGFTVKWLVQAQIDQRRSGHIDPRVGNLDAESVVPWIAWGAYFWADGLNPRSDGLTWTRADFENDGTHKSQQGEEKEAAMLLAFFKREPTARSWFLAPVRRRAVRH
jgi:hypothetical protein